MVTVTFTVPLPAGDVATIWVAFTKVTDGATLPPNLTIGVLVKLDPVMVTLVPPVVIPEVGLIPVTVGAGT